MLERLETLPPDPILSLGQAFEADPRPHKIGLSVGVYRDESGLTPVPAAVKAAERRLVECQTTKAYIGQRGAPEFLKGMQALVFGEDFARADALALTQTAGGCGAVRLGAELIAAARDRGAARVWLSRPTWGNHVPLLTSAGLEVAEYPYYDRASSTLEFTAMMACLEAATPGDVVLLHGCCHNPTGADIDAAQWQGVAELCRRRSLLPFVDLAYQGFGEGLEADASGVRQLAETVPELIVAVSCSKNFGLYRERVGLLAVVADGAAAARAAESHMLALARTSYTMAPFHGAGLVGLILTDPTLHASWVQELDSMRARIKQMRTALAEALANAIPERDFGFIARQHGMFSFLGLSVEQCARLRDEHAVYLLDSSRINIAGLNAAAIEPCAAAIAAVITD
jgi:aspartate/tyrosine/aromatic aminotransferase